MAKQGGSLTADTNAEVLSADETRTSLILQNADASAVIYVEFGAAASTTSTDDSMILAAATTIILDSVTCPDIKKTVNLKSTGTPQYHVRDYAA